MDPLQPPTQESTLLEEYQALVLAEKECVQSVRDMEREVKEIMGTRQREEQHLLLVPYYDVVRNAKEESDEEKEQEQAVEHDYLSAFLPQSSRIMSESEAKSVRERCLQALKDRLIERANTIQSRHDEETAALAKRQANFQRDRDQPSRAEEEEYERAWILLHIWNTRPLPLSPLRVEGGASQLVRQDGVRQVEILRLTVGIGQPVLLRGVLREGVQGVEVLYGRLEARPALRAVRRPPP